MRNPLLFFFITLFLLQLPYASATAKPLPPVQVMLHQNPLSEEEIQITFTIKALVDAEAVSILMVLPPELVLIEGEESWEGPLKSGTTQEIKVLVLNPGDLGAVIEGQASIRFSNGAVFVQQRTLVLNGPKAKPPQPLHQKGTGNGVIEFKGE